MGRGGVGFNPARDCDAVIRDVRRRTARERVRITDLFKDFDRLQHGEDLEYACTVRRRCHQRSLSNGSGFERSRVFRSVGRSFVVMPREL